MILKMAKLSANELRNGTIFIYKNDPWVVLKYKHVKLGRGSATIKVKIKNLKNGNIVSTGFEQNIRFEEADVMRVTGQYLYQDTVKAYFMNSRTYEQYSIDKEVVKDSLKYLKEGGLVTLVIFEDKLIEVELPKSIVLEVTYAEPAVKGDTTGTPMKRVRVETGLDIKVPLFIKKGDRIKINPETGSYVSRVSEEK